MARFVWICAVVLVAEFSAGLAQTAASSKANACDLEIIEKIKEIWECQGYENGYPEHIVDAYKSLGYLNTIGLTEGYLAIQNEVSCLFFAFTDSGFNTYFQVNSSLLGSYRDTREENGIFHNPENGDKMYMIFVNYGGIFAFYRCNDDGPAGTPAGGINTARVFCPKALCDVEQTLYDLGINVSHRFNIGCGPCHPSC